MPDFENALAKAVMRSLSEEGETDRISKRPPEIEAQRIIDLYNDMQASSPFPKAIWSPGNRG